MSSDFLLRICVVSRRRLHCLATCLLLGAGLFATPAMSAERIALYSYYSDPPFDAASSNNLTARLADWLSRRSAGRYQFVATGIARPALDALVQRPHWQGVVAWVHPSWFGQPPTPALAWTEPFMQDSDVVVSRTDRPVEYLDAGASLAGLRVCAVQGHRLPDLQWLLDAGRLQRIDAASEQACLRALREGGSDAALVQMASWTYWQRQNPDALNGLSLAHQPRKTYGRHLALAAGQPALQAFLVQQLSQLAQDPDWHGVLPSPPRQLRLVSVVPQQRPDARALRRIFDAVFEQAGLRYSVAWRPAERAVAEFAAGHFDGDMGRPAGYAASLPWARRVDPPYAQSSIVLLMNGKPRAPLGDGELRQLHVLVPKGYKLLELRAKALPHAEFVVSPLVCARMVRERRADVCLSLTDIGGRWIGQAQLGGSFHVQTLETVDLHLWLSVGLATEAQQLGQAISTLQRSGALERLRALGD